MHGMEIDRNFLRTSLNNEEGFVLRYDGESRRRTNLAEVLSTQINC